MDGGGGGGGMSLIVWINNCLYSLNVLFLLFYRGGGQFQLFICSTLDCSRNSFHGLPSQQKCFTFIFYLPALWEHWTEDVFYCLYCRNGVSYNPFESCWYSCHPPSVACRPNETVKKPSVASRPFYRPFVRLYPHPRCKPLSEMKDVLESVTVY